ncbi:MAG TPA: ABC transporter substrate-binding protein, partial [Acidimicrobiia bacterium]|nr:ABC transporter substrate-binding protein [Acidimicrobiia bacterium]
DNGPSASFTVKPEEIKRTLEGLADYFNSRFQFYGRKIKLVFFDGKGNFQTELQGGGQEEVEADAIKASEEIKAFGDIIGISAPYDDALARRGVMSFGAPFMSQEWMAARRPYAWSPTPDCTFIEQSVSDYVVKRLIGKPAKWAAGDLKGKPRTTAVIAPENPWYQQCVEAGEKVMRAAGHPDQDNIKYKLDFNTLSNQAASVIAKLKSEKITTVICGCDPAFPIFLTSKAQEQGYSPEWIITGAAFIDLDILGQLYQQDQWSHSLGLSFNGPLQPLRATTGYNAFKIARPNEEPSNLVDLLYYNMYTMAIGLQQAGPNLTPETFERGMYAYPGGSGPAGTWKFVPGRYTPNQDAREIYWDRNAISPQNKQKGSYVETMPGRRIRPGDWPATDPAVPER